MVSRFEKKPYRVGRCNSILLLTKMITAVVFNNLHVGTQIYNIRFFFVCGGVAAEQTGQGDVSTNEADRMGQLLLGKVDENSDGVMVRPVYV